VTQTETSRGERDLKAGEKRAVALLGVPTMALSLSATIVTTYLPVVAKEFGGSTAVIGVVIGIEGLLALWLPLVVGSQSDRLRTRLGGRLPFLLGGSPLLAAGLVAMGLVGSMGTLAVAALVFFLGYFLAYEPYRALYPDLIADEAAGRAQGTQALWRGAGTGIALFAGGLLLGLGQAVPFVAVAVVYVAAVAVFSGVLARRGVPDRDEGGEAGSLREAFADVLALVREHGELRAFLVANALWELSLGALKTFVVLYVTEGLGFSRTTASLFIGGVAVLVLFAALAGGKLADRFGRTDVLRIALPVFGLGLLVPFLVTTPGIIALSVPFIAIGGGVLMALPYAVLQPLMPDGRHGALTGYYSLSRGLGTWLGPLVAGLAITALSGPFSSTHGYQAVWGVCAAASLLSLLPLRRLHEHERREASRG
jgi:Na+/melibiose symporter-like transporter